MFPHRPKSLVWSAGTALLALLFVSGPTSADIYYETVYVPTSSVFSLPTSSLLSTSYVVPASYTSSYIPTSYTSSYIPTSYTSSYIPTSYTSTYIPTSTVLSSDSVLVPTSTLYYRPSIFRSRRLVERTSYSYLPTSAILPTSYSYIAPVSYVRSSIVPTSFLVDDSLVTTSMPSLPCETSPSVAPTRSTGKPLSNSNGNGQSIVSQPSNVGTSNERRPTSSLNNTPSGDEGTRSDVPPPVTVPTTPPPVPKATDTGTPLPQPPVVGESGTLPKAPTPGAATGNEGVVVPGPGQVGGNPATSPNETMSRQSKKPVFDTRNVLRGKVISADTKQAEEGILVILSNQKSFVDRQALTDAFGEFKISLPDGDWSVKVKMPSGSIVAVGQEYVTASSGKITDASGRGVGEMLIRR